MEAFILFSVCYDISPLNWVYHLPVQVKGSPEKYANGILDNPKTIKGIKDNKWDMQSEIIGIYVKNDILYFQLALQNNSPLDYSVDLIRFYISDKKKSKRTAVQEIDLKPLHIAGNTGIVKAGTTSVAVFALDKFTIPDAKYFGVQIMEKNGGRLLHMKVANRKLMKAIVLPNFK
jgi:conjugative transposon TraN protein